MVWIDASGIKVRSCRRALIGAELHRHRRHDESRQLYCLHLHLLLSWLHIPRVNNLYRGRRSPYYSFLSAASYLIPPTTQTIAHHEPLPRSLGPGKEAMARGSLSSLTLAPAQKRCLRILQPGIPADDRPEDPYHVSGGDWNVGGSCQVQWRRRHCGR